MKKIEFLQQSLITLTGPVIYTASADKILADAVVLKGEIPLEQLAEIYKERVWQMPDWLKRLYDKQQQPLNVLVIKDLAKLDKRKQLKFMELLKYHRAGKFELPKNSIVVILEKNIAALNEQIVSLCAVI